MADERREITRADLPAEFTPETLRRLPLAQLRRLAKPGNGVLAPDEQATFNRVLHEVMRDTAGRVSEQIKRSDWADVRRQTRRQEARQGARGGSRQPPSRVDEQLNRLTRRVDQQVDLAESLAPGVDWSFTQPSLAEDADAPDAAEVAEVAVADATVTGPDDATSVAELEDRITEQVELIQVMSEIADMSKRTYALEQQRDLQNTRGVFFGFVVSVAVLVAGWAPVVAAEDWAQRFWILGLTLGTCLAAALVYGLIRWRQNREHPATDD